MRRSDTTRSWAGELAGVRVAERIWVLDLDGVVWLGHRPIEGSVAAIDRLRRREVRVVFCTNHAEAPDVKRSELARIGVEDADVVTSLEAAVAMTAPGERLAMLGSSSAVAAVATHRDVADLNRLEPWTVPSAIDAVIIGPHGDWNRERVGAAAALVLAGARLIATNADPTFPTSTPDGRPWLLPGNGALVAAVEAATGVAAVVAGKPNAAMAGLITNRFGPVERVVGDRLDTDGGLAAALGARFALVLSGATSGESLSSGLGSVSGLASIDVAEDLAAVAARWA